MIHWDKSQLPQGDRASQGRCGREWSKWRAWGPGVLGKSDPPPRSSASGDYPGRVRRHKAWIISRRDGVRVRFGGPVTQTKEGFLVMKNEGFG